MESTMNMPSTITFTGIDPSNTREDLASLLSADPRVELGILYSESRAGSGRYPPPAWIRETAEWMGFKRAALHVCGRTVKKVIYGEPLEGKIGSFWHFHRVQLNGRFNSEEAGQLRHFIGPESLAYKVITQFDSNPELHEFCRRPSHQVLFDSSGGRGLLRQEWPKALLDNECGYAGGLSPENLRAELPRIAAVAGRNYWIDMESSLRDEHDRFSIDRARLALMAIWHAEGFEQIERKDNGNT